MKRTLFALIAAAFVLAGCSDSVVNTDSDVAPKRTDDSNMNIVDLASADGGDFTTLAAAVSAAGLVDALSAKGQMTVFAPTNAAFDGLFAFLASEFGLTPTDILTDTDLLTNVLLYHVVPGRRYSDDVLGAEKIRMKNGEFVYVNAAEGKLEHYLGDSILGPIDVEASNGIIHAIDAVLIPKSAVDYLNAMYPQAASKREDTSGNNLVNLVISNPDVDGDGMGDFDTLLAAVTAGSLNGAIVELLSQKGQLTVFAPTDAAFAKIPAGTLNAIIADGDALANILAYHVAKGRRDSGQVTTSDQIRMLNGEFTEISEMEGHFYINDSKIIVVDVPASNGIVHVIDTVLIP